MNESYEGFINLIEEIKNSSHSLLEIIDFFEVISKNIQDSDLEEREKADLKSRIIFEKEELKKEIQENTKKKEMEEKIKKYKRRISTSDKKELEKIKNEIQNDDKLINELSSCIKDRENAFSTKSDDEPDKEWEPKF
ncbi:MULTISPECIES: hypothetical protein [Fusobacterium]|uniref:Uncharacterized protein n=1 Tax=Fusobacterium animalis F0419 TaxID=999414 RepID=H1HEY5_9FUSO|nr:hypothetical protein [Fusobacterium animalis]EHO78137.1 hypothetical protein HMPREF9942_01036 [Fusobacterium animalis F0419]